jgi:hypothetical protein
MERVIDFNMDEEDQPKYFWCHLCKTKVNVIICPDEETTQCKLSIFNSFK